MLHIRWLEHSCGHQKEPTVFDNLVIHDLLLSSLTNLLGGLRLQKPTQTMFTDHTWLRWSPKRTHRVMRNIEPEYAFLKIISCIGRMIFQNVHLAQQNFQKANIVWWETENVCVDHLTHGKVSHLINSLNVHMVLAVSQSPRHIKLYSSLLYQSDRSRGYACTDEHEEESF